MDYRDIIIELNGQVTTILLNRPQALNALSPNLIHELKCALQMITADVNCKVLIVKGAGRAFSAGVN